MKRRLSVTTLSLGNNLPTFWLNALMTTGAFSRNAGKLFSELKLVTDNILFIYGGWRLHPHYSKHKKSWRLGMSPDAKKAYLQKVLTAPLKHKTCYLRRWQINTVIQQLQPTYRKVMKNWRSAWADPFWTLEQSSKAYRYQGVYHSCPWKGQFTGSNGGQQNWATTPHDYGIQKWPFQVWLLNVCCLQTLQPHCRCGWGIWEIASVYHLCNKDHTASLKPFKHGNAWLAKRCWQETNQVHHSTSQVRRSTSQVHRSTNPVYRLTSQVQDGHNFSGVWVSMATTALPAACTTVVFSTWML